MKSKGVTRKEQIMAANQEARAMEFMDQASETIGAAVKAGARFQEDLASFWMTSLGQGDALQQWQAKSRALLSQAMPAVQQSADEWLRLWGRGYYSGIELMKKAFDSTRCQNVSECQGKMQELWDASMTTLKSTTQAMAQANVRAMESFANVLRQAGNGVEVEEKVEKSARGSKAAAGAR